MKKKITDKKKVQKIEDCGRRMNKLKREGNRGKDE